MEPEVWYSPTDECYLARCSDMPGIIGAGASERQALMELGVARQAAQDALFDRRGMARLTPEQLDTLATMGVEYSLQDYVFVVTQDIVFLGATIPIGTVGMVTMSYPVDIYRVVFEPDCIVPFGVRVPGFSIPSLLEWHDHLRAVFINIDIEPICDSSN